ncbi:MAG: hypothetical protein K0R27_227 [Xanthobacteraceae bacterium]|jgi:lipoprotein-anchoring transpeptidase ErfK/SrfK|nr:hypothetical protein [Xanthobacteraceae bacterium]
MEAPRFSVLSLALLFALIGTPGFALTAEDVRQATFRSDTRDGAKEPDPFIAKAQVLLSRRSISPGVIDGIDGENYRKAVAQFRRQERLGEGDEMDEQTWRALGGDTAGDIVTEYVLSKKDASMKFARRIPRDYARQAAMRRLAYTSAEEMFAERFHMSDGLLRALNPRAKYRKAGERILVVSVERAPPQAAVERIDAVKSTGMVVVYGPGDTILASYPATIGSSETPSPEGEYSVKRIARNPTYHYDPEKNFQQGRNKRKLVLPPGPNNPVGTVWIALSKPTFGIHGTPEPSQVSKTSSHGCVRLTNWDADELADLVKPGVPVRFVE